MPQKTAKQARALFMILLGLSLLPFSARADRLEDTRLYQMAQQENFSDFLRAVDSFESLYTLQKRQLVEARDGREGNIFHLLAGVKKHREKFALEMIRLAVFSGSRDFLNARNQEGLRPEGVARRRETIRLLRFFIC